MYDVFAFEKKWIFLDVDSEETLFHDLFCEK